MKAPDVLKDIAGLETNRINQLVVRPTLQTTRDDNIFAIGDCSACSWGEHGNVPPRAQAAHQQSSASLHPDSAAPAGQAVGRTIGTGTSDLLVSLGEFSTVGSMMGSLVGGNLVFAGIFARMMYLSLYKMHEHALHGSVKVALDTLARLITRRTEPHVKLHYGGREG